MSTISPGIGKYCDNIYDHRKNGTTESRFEGSNRTNVATPDDQNGDDDDDEIGPKITTDRRKGDSENVVGIWEIGLGRSLASM